MIQVNIQTNPNIRYDRTALKINTTLRLSGYEIRLNSEYLINKWSGPFL